MDVIEATRAVGTALQEHPAYKKMQEVSALCDEDKELQDMIGHFNLTRMNLDAEMQKPKAERDSEKIMQLNANLQAAYEHIMTLPNMVAYNMAKDELDNLLKRINGIINNCANGEDPATTDYSACTHDCSTCGACH